MNSVLQRKLLSRFPKIFSSHPELDNNPCDIAVDDGWYLLINALCEQLQFFTEERGDPQVEARQVKEKFGGLRFHQRAAISEAQGAVIELTERLAATTCEKCGCPGFLRSDMPWVKTLCDKHARVLHERKTFFGLTVHDVGSARGVLESEIAMLPFYKFWLESSTGSTMRTGEHGSNLIYLSDWEMFSTLFINEGRHRWQP